MTDDRITTTLLFQSLDGIVEADDTWQFAYFDEELFEGITAAWARAGAVLMGRRSYEGYDRLRHTHPDSPAVAFLDRTPKHVVSSTLTDVDWPGTTLLAGDLGDQVPAISTPAGTDLLVLGSPTLVRGLLRLRLLDELRLTVLPIIVGSGVRLFVDDDLGDHLPLGLAESRALSSGALELRYAM